MNRPVATDSLRATKVPGLLSPAAMDGRSAVALERATTFDSAVRLVPSNRPDRCQPGPRWPVIHSRSRRAKYAIMSGAGTAEKGTDNMN